MTDTHDDQPGSELEVIPDGMPPELLTREQDLAAPPAAFSLQLPDGHVLRLAHAEPGTVVEIASWTGPGRPDGKTSRLMVGIAREAQPQRPVADVHDIPATEITSPADEIVIYEPVAKRRRWVKPVVAAVLVAAAGVGLYFSPLVAVRPTAGTTVSLGGASNAIVVALPTDTLAKGQTVVAYLDYAHSAAVLGRVNQVAGDSVLVQTDQAFAQTSRDRVAGRVVIVIPYVGRLLRR